MGRLGRLGLCWREGGRGSPLTPGRVWGPADGGALGRPAGAAVDRLDAHCCLGGLRGVAGLLRLGGGGMGRYGTRRGGAGGGMGCCLCWLECVDGMC